MEIQLKTALISLSGICLTVLISWVTSRLQTKVAIKKIYGDFSTKLYEKRLEFYPPLFELMSNLNKALKDRNLEKEALNKFFFKFQKLDSKTGLFFSSPSIEACHELRQGLIELLKKDDNKYKAILDSDDTTYGYRQKVQAMELALKYELGVFGFDSPMKFQKSKLFKKYYEFWPVKRKLSVWIRNLLTSINLTL
ncbi:MAG: hypothetical protein JRE64_02115 [Deltaproteobacteria bacterium]|nr:hypothetical protein [Deltaproteobacteria bacterium]